MTRQPETHWTIDELANQVAQALSVGYAGQASGRVRDVPNHRTIRYYTTLGLLDRPAALRGRTALYGRRHLLQLVAIKRLQAQGLSLADLQQRLVGLPDADLARLARISATADRPAIRGAPDTAEASPRAADFWREGPADFAADGRNGEAPAAPPTEETMPLQGIRLANDVTLLLTPARRLERDDLDAIRTVAGPLLKLLEDRRLLRPPQERRNP